MKMVSSVARRIEEKRFVLGADIELAELELSCIRHRPSGKILETETHM